MEKVLEATVYEHIVFVNEAFEFCYRHNNGFLEGRRTSDYLFVPNGLVERQLIMNKRLYACFIDFPTAFDMINKTMLFCRSIKNRWKGRVIDTFRSLYSKTHFLLIGNVNSSPPVLCTQVVIQCTISSGLRFRGLRFHPVFRESHWSVKQLDGLLKFCSKRNIIDNDTKTRVTCFGTDENFNIYFNKKPIEPICPYKYLVGIVRSINKNMQMFSDNYRLISEIFSRKAIISMKHEFKFVQTLPCSIMFDTLIRLILTYGSNV